MRSGIEDLTRGACQFHALASNRQVEKAHGKRIILDTTPLNGTPSSSVSTINFVPRHFN